MPYTAEHKARTREKIVENARLIFNRKGFEQASIDEIMGAAGLTRGGFYKHFTSKEELYAAAVRSFETCNPFAREVAKRGAPPTPALRARRLVELYLSDAVLENRNDHCPMIALPSDVARAGVKPRNAYTGIMRRMLAVFRGAFPVDDATADHKAQVILGLCVGGMVLARTTTDADLRRSLRASALSQALTLLEEFSS